jgi:hypothetical protein
MAKLARIAPPRALQFEKNVPNSLLPEDQDYYWVMPPERGGTGAYDPRTGSKGNYCHCDVSYDVIPDLLSRSNRDFLATLPSNIKLSLCACVGRIIE